MGWRCEKCGHEWIPRGESGEPDLCPSCKSPKWNQPSKAATTYEEFRDQIRKALQESDAPLTWTEIRTAARLPQKFPNNQWVHRLERDIGLKRERSANGIVLWRVE